MAGPEHLRDDGECNATGVFHRTVPRSPFAALRQEIGMALHIAIDGDSTGGAP
jgi:hypothetical protein